MDPLPVDVDSIAVEKSMFDGVGFCVSGTVDSKIMKLLESGGAKLRSFAGVGTTHLIAGNGADEMKIEEAKEIFEVPAVSPRWAVFSAKLGKVLPVEGFGVLPKQLFCSVVATASGIKGDDLKAVWTNVTFYGGRFEKRLTSKTTHLIVNSCTGEKYAVAKAKGLKIVSCDWLINSIKSNSIIDESGFDPALITTVSSPKPVFIGKDDQSGIKKEVESKGANVMGRLPNVTTQVQTSAQSSQYSMVRPPMPTVSQNILQHQLMGPSQAQNHRMSIPTGQRLIQPGSNQHLQHKLQPQQQNQRLPLQSQSMNQNQTIPITGQGHHPGLQGQGSNSLMLQHASSNQLGIQSPGTQMQGQMSQHQFNQSHPIMQIQGAHHQLGQPIQQQMLKQTALQGQSGQNQGSVQHMPNQGAQPHLGHAPQQSQLTHGQISQQGQSQGSHQSMQGPISQQQNIPLSMAQHNQIAHQQLQSMPQQHNLSPLSQQHTNPLSKQQGSTNIPSSQQLIKNEGSQQQMMPNQGSQHLMPNQGSQQLMQPQIPLQILQNQSPQQILQNQSPQQMMQNQSPQQMHPIQSPSQQMIQNQSPQQIHSIQSPSQQMLQSHSPQQILQNQSPQRIMHNQSPQQVMQNQNQQQILQNQPHIIQIQGNSQMLQSQGTAHILQGQPNQQMIQSQGQPQMMQNQGQMIPNQGQQQLIQNQGQQQLIQNQGQQQLIQNQGQQQLIQNQGQQQLIQNQGQQQLIQNQGQQQLIQNQGQQQLIQNQGQQQLIQNQGQQQLMQNQGRQQLIQNQGQQQQMGLSQGPQQMMQGQGSQQMIQSPGPQQMIQSPGQQMIQSPGQQQMIRSPGPPSMQHPSNQSVHHVQHQVYQQQLQGQMQYQNQSMQHMPFQAQSPIKSQASQHFGQQTHMIQSSQQVRLPLQSPQSQNSSQQIHFQVVQQNQSRPQMMMSQMQARSPFQQPQQGASPQGSNVNQQTMFRQQQSTNPIQLFHPIQQQRMSSQPFSQQPQGTQQGPNQMPGQLQQSQMNQSQMQSNQVQQNQSHYNVIGTQQYSGNNQGIVVHQQQQPGQQLQQQSQQPGQPHVIQKVQFQTRINAQWTQQQQAEIIRQIQLDPQVKQQWAKMDNSQRALLVQKLAQRNREEHLRREMMQRQQQMNQQTGAPPQQISHTHQQSTMQQVGGSSLVQQVPAMGIQQNSVPNHQISQNQSDKSLGQINPQGLPSSNQLGMIQQQGAQIPLGPQPHPMTQGHQDGSKSNPTLGMTNQVLVQNQQKVLNPQGSPSNPQKFLAPAPIQTRPQTHGTIGGTQQHSPQGSSMVRTQQIFTPQVGQQQPRMNVRQILVHPGQSPRPQVVMQQVSSQKMAILQGQNSPQSPSSNPWLGNQQRFSVPGSQIPQRLTSPEQPAGGTHIWNVRSQSQLTPSPTGNQSSVSYVQVVNSKTKTALANLLSNRLQGNSGPESSAASASTTLTSTTPANPTMCPPPPPPVTSQSLPLSAPATTQSNILIQSQRRTLANITNGSKTIQVNSFGVARVAVSQASATLPTTPPRPQFFGHDPQMKLPAEAFLLGCAFWAAENLQMPDWPSVVVKFGGSFVSEYSPTLVTHVLCRTQKFPEFQQVLRDGKRLVTLHWLSDMALRKVMLPPFYALHLPVPFTDDDRPMKEHVMSLTGFQSEERERVKAMIQILGAKMTTYFSQLNTCLVACRVEGRLKFQKAREWKTAVVSVQFLNEMLLGHPSSLQMIHSPKYQHFNVEQPFRFDIALAPHLMAAWKVPLRVSSDTFEKYKAMKRPLDSDDLPSSKKRKLEFDDEPLSPSAVELKTEPGKDLKLKQEVDLIENRIPPVVMLSGFTRIFKTKLQQKIQNLGGAITEDYKEATHLILKEDFVTSKLFIAISRMQFVVTCYWIKDSLSAKKFIDERLYIPRHVPFETKYGLSLADTLAKPLRHMLFKGLTFFITPGLIHNRGNVESVIESAGGIVDRKQRSLKTIRELCSRSPKKFIIITCDDDFGLMESYFMGARRPHLINIFTDSFIWYCIGTQRVKFRQTTV